MLVLAESGQVEGSVGVASSDVAYFNGNPASQVPPGDILFTQRRSLGLEFNSQGSQLRIPEQRQPNIHCIRNASDLG